MFLNGSTSTIDCISWGPFSCVRISWSVLDSGKELVDWFFENHVNPLPHSILIINLAFIPLFEWSLTSGGCSSSFLRLLDIFLQTGEHLDLRIWGPEGRLQSWASSSPGVSPRGSSWACSSSLPTPRSTLQSCYTSPNTACCGCELIRSCPSSASKENLRLLVPSC